MSKTLILDGVPFYLDGLKGLGRADFVEMVERNQIDPNANWPSFWNIDKVYDKLMKAAGLEVEKKPMFSSKKKKEHKKD
jgi:hypothetical protein